MPTPVSVARRLLLAKGHRALVDVQSTGVAPKSAMSASFFGSAHDRRTSGTGIVFCNANRVEASSLSPMEYLEQDEIEHVTGLENFL